MKRKNNYRPAGRNAWIFGVALSIITAFFTWVIIPLVFRLNPILKVFLPVSYMIGSGLAAFALLGALKLYLERDDERSTRNPQNTNFPPSHLPQQTITISAQHAPDSPIVPQTTTTTHASPAANNNVKQFLISEDSHPKEWTLDLIRSLEWKRFEDLCAEFYKSKGLRAETTGLGADGGVDIRLYDPSGQLFAVVQCKAWKRTVKVPLIRELAGVMMQEKAQRGVFITTSTFSDDAIATAKKLGVVLVTGSSLFNGIKTLPETEQNRLLQFATAGDYRTPTCPHCGVKMIIKKGYSEFWGCPNFPKCRQTIKIRS